MEKPLCSNQPENDSGALRHKFGKKRGADRPLFRTCIGPPPGDVPGRISWQLVQDSGSAAVLCPRLLIGACHGRTFLTVGDDLDAGRVNTLRQQIVTGRSSATLAKGKVVFAGTALVTMAFNGHCQRRVTVQESRLAIQGCLRVAVKRCAVIGEVNSVANAGQLVCSRVSACSGAGRRA